MATRKRAIAVAAGWLLAIGIGAGAVVAQVDESTTTTTTTTSTTSSSSTTTTTSGTTTTTVPGSDVNCPLTNAGAACWAAHTGVQNLVANDGTFWTAAQIRNNTLVNGHRPSEQLTHVTGTQVFNTPNQTVQNEWISGGCLTIGANATNLHLKNIFVDGAYSCTPGGSGWAQANSSPNTSINGGNPAEGQCCTATGIVIEYLLYEGGNTCCGYDAAGMGVGHATMRFSNLSGTRHTVYPSNGDVFENIYVHDTTNADWPNHVETLNPDSTSGYSIRHSYIDNGICAINQKACTAAINAGNSYGAAPHNYTITDTYFNGCRQPGSNGCGPHINMDPGAGNIVWMNNRFSPDTWVCNTASGGPPWGSNGNVWTGNQWSETLASIPAPPCT